MFPLTLRRSLLAKALLAIGVLLLVTVLRACSVAGVHWMGWHDVPALAAITALHEAENAFWRHEGIGTPAQARHAAVQMQRHLYDEALRGAVERPGRAALQAAWERLDARWSARLRPALEQGRVADYWRQVGPFSHDLALLTSGLQTEHAELLALDRRIAILTMVTFLCLLTAGLYVLLRRVVLPLRELLAATDHFRAGNLDVRVRYEAPDEIGRLAERFNAMADDLASSHRDLERRVQEKMLHLGRANAALELLFRSSAELAQGTADAAAIADLLTRFQALLPGLDLTLCLQLQGSGGPLIALHGDATPQICTLDECGRCAVATRPGQRCYEVRCGGEVLGQLRACFEAAQSPEPAEPPEPELVQALADLIGSALAFGRQREKDSHLLLLNERNTIARELHDSLAQSLSYMKIQVARLQAMIRRHDDCARVESVATELREGINDAYRQLRELLTTFRLGLGGDELGDALQAAVQEFSQRGGISILLEADTLLLPLSGVEQIHVVQIAREALANCLRHAGARHAWVCLRQRGPEVELVIEDDGQGLSPLASEVQRHGMTIMRERAHSIGGTLTVGPRHPRGTRVRLRFRPGTAAAEPEGRGA
ncbi:MAG TPA: histidine kinase [Moraxellaceae bacterium]|nr:histidine kinase [Moraxellaceae bacterium]